MDYDEFYLEELEALDLYNYFEVVELVLKTPSEIMEDLKDYDLGTINGVAIVPTSFGGYLDSINKKIVVDSTDIEDNIKNTIAHEVRHLYQRVLVQLMVDGKDLSSLIEEDIVKRWHYEMTNKVNHVDSEMEKDACKYADNRYLRN